MNRIRLVALTALFSAIFFSAITYTACKKDSCHNVVCQNLGTCDGGICTCPVGYEGSRCDTLSRDKFVYTYNGGDSCGIPVYYTQYPIKLLAVINNPFELTMMNFLNNPQDSALCTIQSVDSFTFIGANNSTTYSGYGKLSHDSLHMTYHVEHDTTSYDCHYFGQSLRVGVGH